ncbi:MAG: cell division ATPase MinD [Candidatus Micrarchaeota archaeon]
MRTIIIASGKGGVGKTSIAVNLGIALSQMGKRVIVVDADVSMANVGIILGIDRAPISLHNVLMGEVNIRDAVYEGPGKVKYVPSSLSLERVKKMVLEKFPDAIKDLEPVADYVLIDCPPGVDRMVEAAISAAKEMIVIVTPDPASLADAMKIISFASKKGVATVGFIENMVLNDKSEIKKEEIETMLSMKMIHAIPEDIEVRRAAAVQVPFIIRNPNSPASREIRVLAGRITGEQIKVEQKVRKGFFASLMEAIFGKKKQQ